MTLDQVPSGARVLVDSNILVYHFQPHPVFGPMCNRLLERIERRDIEGNYTRCRLLQPRSRGFPGSGVGPSFTTGHVLLALAQPRSSSAPFTGLSAERCRPVVHDG